MAQQIQLRRGTAAQATAANPTLAEGEMGLETDTGKFKIGNGVTAWNSLGYASAIPMGGTTGQALLKNSDSDFDLEWGDVASSDATISFTDITTNNASTTKHGFLKKLSNVSTEFMNGQGNWVSVSASPGGSDTQLQYNSSSSFAGAAALTTDGSKLTNTQAVATTSTDGYVLATSATATAGNQKFSPRVRWLGSGWKTNATAAAQNVEFMAEVQPIQGAAAPTGILALGTQINGGGFTTRFQFGSDGTWSPYSNKNAGSIRVDDTNFGLILTAASTNDLWVSSIGLRFKSGLGVQWTSDTTTAVAGADVGVFRLSAGLIGVGTGGSTSFAADVKLRGVIWGSTLTVGTLPAAATAGDGATYRVTDLTTPTLGAAPTGGGAVKGLVTSNGSSYTVTQFG